MFARMKALAFAALLLLGCASTRSNVAASKPDPDLDYFVGNWVINGEDPGSGKKFTLNYRIEPTLDGVWLTGFADSPSMPLKIRDFWGHDPATKGLVRIIVDSGANHGVARATGWQGDTLLFEGTAHGDDGELTVRETITKVSASEFKAVWEAKLEKGWTAYSVEHLQRQ